MAETYTKEQLNQMDRKEHTALTLSLQERLVLVEEKNKKLDRTLQLIYGRTI